MRRPGREPKGSSSVDSQSLESEVQVNTNSSNTVGKTSGRRCGTTLQEAMEAGAHSQWKHASSCAMGVVPLAPPIKSTYWVDLSGEPLGPGEAQTARRRDIEYFRQMCLCWKVPASKACEGGQTNSEHVGRILRIRARLTVPASWRRKATRATLQNYSPRLHPSSR